MQQKPKGTRDFLPQDTLKLQIIESLIKQTVETYDYREIRTPIFEHTEVFERSSGDSSDIVNKEMYTFKDRGNRSISLRPEGTAGVIRSFIENKMYVEADLPVRLYYVGPNFRYERPQAGRFRQFVQFGVESIGIRSPYLDAEVILMALDVLNSVGITNVTVKINSIGDTASREAYKKALRDYFEPYLPELCSDCKVRYEKNPLRILDCKVDKDHPCMKGYPKIEDYLSSDAKAYFAKVLEVLDSFEVSYEVDPKMVRGLDYYNDTVFEIYATSPSGTDYGAILAGGRYDNLVKEFDGPSLPAFGFGLGMDRVAALVEELGVLNQFQDALTAYVMPRDEEAFSYAYFVCNFLRVNGIDCDMDFQLRSIKSQFKSVDKKKASYAILIGSTELVNQTVTVKVNATKEQTTMPITDLIPFLKDMLNHNTHECGCGHHHEDGEECSCGHHHEHGEECGCGHHHEDGEECCCGHNHEHGEECGCGHHHEDGEECGCGHHHEHGEECGCGHHHEDGEECGCGHHHEDGEECGCGHHHEDGEKCSCGHHHDKKRGN